MRGAATPLAAYQKATVPLPVPLAPEVIVSHEALLVAVQVQPVVVVTVTVLAPAAAAGWATSANGEVAGCVGLSHRHRLARSIKVAVRGADAPLAAIEKATVPLPVPLAPDIDGDP